MTSFVLTPEPQNVAPTLTQASDPLPPESYPDRQTSWFQQQLLKGRQGIAFALTQAWTLTLLIKHPRAPWPAKLVATCTVAYLISPVQIIPTFIPVVGQLDDLFVLFLGMKLIHKLTPGEILAECETQARSSIFVQRLQGDCASSATTQRCIPQAGELNTTVPIEDMTAANGLEAAIVAPLREARTFGGTRGRTL